MCYWFGLQREQQTERTGKQPALTNMEISLNLEFISIHPSIYLGQVKAAAIQYWVTVDICLAFITLVKQHSHKKMDFQISSNGLDDVCRLELVSLSKNIRSRLQRLLEFSPWRHLPSVCVRLWFLKTRKCVMGLWDRWKEWQTWVTEGTSQHCWRGFWGVFP